MRLTRRDFAAGSVAAMAFAALGRAAFAAPLPREVDVAVIGAGAAGIAAARKIMAAGRKAVILEATNVIGGRCLTDTTSLGVPFDRGARWLYNSDTNPVNKLARGAGMDMFPAPRGQKIRVGRRNARAGETEDFLAMLVRASRAIDDAGRRSDIAAAAALPKDLGDWTGSANFLLGPYQTGKDLTDLSSLDFGFAQRRDLAAACRQGVGALVAKLADNLPISLATPVTRISWGGRDVQIETPQGTLTAKAVIVTASTNALLSGKMKFTPELPKRHTDAAAKLSLGSMNRIVLELPGNPLGVAREDPFIEQSTDNRTAFLLANPDSTRLCAIDVSGSFGRDLASRGDAEMLAFAREYLSKLFGTDATAIKASSVTRWDAAPYALGAMSAASPGGYASRKILMEPLGPLLLAGEAAHETLGGTVGGAWESGERAADIALKRLSGAKDAQPFAQPPQAKAKTRRREPREASGSAAPPPRGAQGGLFWPGR